MRYPLAALVAVLLVGLLPVTAPRASAQAERPSARLEVTKITPSVVEGSSPGEVTVAGRVTNTSDRTISNIEARVERGSPVDSEAKAQEAMRGRLTSVNRPRFSPVSDTLAPGQQVPFELRIPLTGGPESLQLTGPGVLPLRLNVNGDPEFGDTARVAEAQFLLPVLAPPGAPPARPPTPTPMTMLVPIVDYPRMEQERATAPPTRLIDDQLSTSLAPGGRLYDLVQSIGESAGPGSKLGNALCFVIDPDLLATVKAMQEGYQVRQPNRSLQEGIGAEAARLWLSKLKEVTAGRCVIALPYADADVVALGRSGLPDLIKGAFDGARLVRETLQVSPSTDVLWPIDGVMDQPAAGQLADAGVRTLLMQPRALTTPRGSLQPVRLRGDNAPSVVPIDPLLSAALDPLRNTNMKSTALSPPDNGALSAQNALGAMTVRATKAPVPGATSVLAPPRRWNLKAEDLRSMLTGMSRLADGGYIRPTGLPAPASGSESGPETGTGAQNGRLPEVDLSYPVSASTDEIPQPVLDGLAQQNYKVGDLFRSSEEERAVDVEPAALTNPLRNGLLRGASSAWRGNPEAARDWVHRAANTLTTVLSAVGLDEFSGQVTRTASNSPIPVTVTNRLPVTVSVVLRVSRMPGITIKDLGVLRIPAQGRRQFLLETTEVTRSGQFSVDVSVATQGGTQLGSTKRLQLESNAYGAVTLMLTITAGALLVVLSALRIVRRIRGNRKARGGGPATRFEAVEVRPDDTPTIPQVATTESDRNTN